MKLSLCMWQTYKEVPADAEIASHRLMIRAGLIHKSGSGLYSYMPFLMRSISKVEAIIREELDKISCQEIQMSVVTSGDLWQESGRWEEFGNLMLKFKDKSGKDLCISPTNEEAIVDIFRKNIKSYKQLPVNLYQVNTKFRDEIRPRFGLMRGREFLMKDAYSFHIDKSCLDDVYENMHQAYTNIFSRIGLDFVAVDADAGAMADSSCKTHEFQVLADSGEDSIIFSEDGSYAANLEKASTLREADFLFQTKNIEMLETPSLCSIAEVCEFLKIPEEQSLKAMVYQSTSKDDKGKLISGCVVVFLLGDDQVNEIKLKSLLKSKELRPATEEELKERSLFKGFIGPLNLPIEVSLIFDSSIHLDASYVVGANKLDKHIKHFIPSRDLEISRFRVGEIRNSKEGDLTTGTKQIVRLKRGIEVGHIFQLGDKYTKSMGASVLDKNGKTIFPLMGCYGIGVTRVVASAIEQCHDDNGIIWPKEIAPYQIHFALIAKSDELKNLGEEIYRLLIDAGLEVLFDDRKVGPGFKFKDADLLGLPLQLILGEKSYQEDQKLEVITRKTGLKTKVSQDELIPFLKDSLKALN